MFHKCAQDVNGTAALPADMVALTALLHGEPSATPKR